MDHFLGMRRPTAALSLVQVAVSKKTEHLVLLRPNF